MNDEKLIEKIITRLTFVQPKIGKEPAAYKRAIMRMAIEEWIKQNDSENKK